MGVACDLGYPCAKFRLPRPFGFRVRADVRDIRQTDRRTTDADDRLMPPPPLTGRGHNNRYHNITTTDVSEAVGHQNKNKSAGPNGLYIVSYIYAGDKLNVHLSLL